MQLTQLSCPSCGAPLNLSKHSVVLNCPFCDAKTLITGRADLKDIDFDATKAKEFQSNSEQFQTALLKWLADGDLTPDDLLEKVSVQEFDGIFMPFWKLSGEFKAQFSCQAGTNTVEKTTIIEDGKSRTKRETVTQWRSYSGEKSAPFGTVVYADESGSGKRVDDELLTFLESTAQKAIDYKDFDAAMSEGYIILDFTIPADTARKGRGHDKIHSFVVQKCEEAVSADKVKDIKITDLITRDVETERLLHPFWIAKFQYNNKMFPVGFSGVDLTANYGVRPVDQERKKIFEELDKPGTIAMWITIVLTIIGLLAFILPGIIIGIVGGIITYMMKSKAAEEKKEILDRSYKIRQNILARATGEALPSSSES